MHLPFVQNSLHEIRGQEIMFDFDLAFFYKTSIPDLLFSVENNRELFPKEFMFRLNKKEWKEHISNGSISESSKTGSAPSYVFTEHGITMLAFVLRTKKANQLGITIVRGYTNLNHHL